MEAPDRECTGIRLFHVLAIGRTCIFRMAFRLMTMNKGANVAIKRVSLIDPVDSLWICCLG